MKWLSSEDERHMAIEFDVPPLKPGDSFSTTQTITMTNTTGTLQHVTVTQTRFISTTEEIIAGLQKIVKDLS